MDFLFRFCTLAVLLVAVGCSGVEGANPFLSGDAGTSQPDASTPNPGECLGCVDSSGACQNGDQASACGLGGAACLSCPDGHVCDENGACLPPPSCAPSNCDGCCDGDECRTGMEDGQCGTGGNSCEACPSGTRCDGGACRFLCGPDTCTGCCDANGDCVEGADDQVCGSGGGSCADCTEQGENCIRRSCVAADCSSSCGAGCCAGDACVDPPTDAQCGGDGSACVDCGPGRSCDTGECAVDPTALFDVELVSGIVAATNADGGSWDAFNGLPDPKVEVTVAGTTGNGPIANDTLAPVWDEVALSDVAASDIMNSISFHFVDADTTFDDEICTVDLTVDANSMAFGGMIVETQCPASSNAFRWRLVAK